MWHAYKRPNWQGKQRIGWWWEQQEQEMVALGQATGGYLLGSTTSVVAVM
jgi:hypothetical protein